MNMPTGVGQGHPSAPPQDLFLTREQLLHRQNTKWRQYPSDVIPAFIADMDFTVAPVVQAAVLRSVMAQDYGYQMRDGAKADRKVGTAFATHMKAAFGWEAEADLVQPLTELVQAIHAAVIAFSDPGDAVIVQVPNYPPFRDTLRATGRKLVPLPMQDDGSRHVFDLDQLERSLTGTERIFLLCNPQNPTGRVFTEEELRAVLAFAEKHDLLVLSDEIHSDLLYGDARHIPFPALSPAAAARCVVLNSATKSFNIPALRCAVMYFGTPELKARFHERIPPRLLGSVSSLGIDATVAAWTEGRDWFLGTRACLEAARDHLCARLTADLPGIRFHVPEATYLAWLDCSGLGISGSAGRFFLDQARIGFSHGEEFDPEAADFIRFNFATSPAIMDEIIDRMVKAVRANSR